MSNKKNILVLTQWSYKDPLIQAYTLPYVYMIAGQIPKESRIYLVTFEQKKLKMSKEERKKVKNSLLQKGIHLIDYTYHPFGLISILKWILILKLLFLLILFKRINYIHAWCTPAASLGYVLSIFTRRPLIIDSYEPHAEAMVENGTWSRSGFKFRILFYLEKKLSRRAGIIISATEGMRDYARRKYGLGIKNFYVKPACTDFSKFNLSKRKNKILVNEFQLEDKIVCVYAGKFGGIYLTNEVFDFFSEAEKFWGNRFRALILTSTSKEELNQWAAKSNFSSDKMIVRFVDHDEIQDYIGLGDFGITPVKPIPTKRYCTPIKDGEYWGLGLPVVITKDISDDSDIISKNNAGAVINDLTRESYKKSIEEINKLLSESKEILSGRIEKLAQQYRSFSIAEKIYKSIYNPD